MASEIHLNDVGISFRTTITDDGGGVLDVSTASVMKIWFQRPDGTTAEYAASFVTDGADGKIHYVTQEGDLSQSGSWKVQGYVVFSGGKIHGEIHKFKVVANLRSDP